MSHCCYSIVCFFMLLLMSLSAQAEPLPTVAQTIVQELEHEVEAIRKEAAGKIQAAIQQSSEQLQTLQDEFTQQNKIEEAIAIRDQIRRLHPEKSITAAINSIRVKNFSEAQFTLEASLRLLEQEFKQSAPQAKFDSSIRILIRDLHMEGITRNATIRDFQQKNKTIAEILTAIVMRANPITTVKDPTDPDQKLVWVIGEDPEDGVTRILITTRTAAAKRRLTLPDVFVKKE